MAKWQIRCNLRKFGDAFGVYEKEEGKMVKQTSYNHGTFEATKEEAYKLHEEVKSKIRFSGINARAWCRLYEIVG